MKKIKTHIIAILAFTFCFSIFGQEKETNNQKPPFLVLRAYAKKDAILLRWGVNDPFAWKYGNEYGYIIERTTIFKDKKPLKEPEKIILTGAPIKPKPLEEWREFVSRNNMAAVTAQAIYGEDFITDDDDNPVMKVMNLSSELEQRFGFSMFAVDQDFEAAQYAGLGFIDYNVKPNERYLYSVKAAVPEELLKIEETGFLMETSEQNILPQPYDFVGYYYNNAFVLIWEYDALVNFYTSYDLEKSEDGIHFSKVNKSPITKLASTSVSGISYTDSIPKYGKKYWYRILGRSLFDEKSKPSDTISVIAYKELLVVPLIENNKIISDKEIILNWSFASEEAWKVSRFDVLRANKPIGPYDIIKEKLSSDVRSYMYNEVQDINYFKIRAHGIGGDFQDSSPYMIQPIDSIPPIVPQGLIGTIDSLGIVQLTWGKNTELDLKGYSIFRSNRPNQEFTKLNKSELQQPNYIDTINTKSFNKKVYYKIVAADNRYNESPPSKILELTRPNTAKPSVPVFKTYEVKEDTVLLKWTKSSSENIVKYVLYRKELTNTLWENVFETNDVDVLDYNDTNTLPNTKYLYSLVAVNNFNVESNPSPPISIYTINKLIKSVIKSLTSLVDRENKSIQLNWRVIEDNIAEIQLFRKVGKENKFTLYQTFSQRQKQYTDTRLEPNSIYTYGIKIIFNDGSLGNWEEIRVMY
ncbi:fibronectin type III domain-containing protein [Zobellia barbeyronii]|uniref:Fibronectin type-III domain-containing protein n=1 Tax=Zobellia barbeyronii TaxID=2748009 RepID=A0ABS5WAL8_9FLAO|nr:hypothetical protein [Zobellia barbeyronii]MBT2160031.1 hypothetical protein [Zobellia barbeyronii]